MTVQARIAGQLFTVYTGNLSPVDGMTFALDVFWHQFTKKKYQSCINLSVNTYLNLVAGKFSQKNLAGVRGPLPKTLSLFMTKICDIPNPIYDLTLKSKPCFQVKTKLP